MNELRPRPPGSQLASTRLVEPRAALRILAGLAAPALAGCSLLFSFADPPETGAMDDGDGGAAPDGDPESDDTAPDGSRPDADSAVPADPDAGPASGSDAGPGDLGGTEVVATLVRHLDAGTGASSCFTGSDLGPGANWDLGAYAFCDDEGLPHCGGAARLLTTASTLRDDGVVVEDLACILTGQATSTVPVAIVYGTWTPVTNARTCLTVADPAAAAAGYWDQGEYSGCTEDHRPFCRNGARAVVTSSTNQPSGQIKQQVACVLGGQQTDAPIVATMESENDTVLGTNRCWTAADPEGPAAGLFDLGDFAFCTEDGIPMCDDGALKVALSASRTSDGDVIRYETACILPGQPSLQNTVAALVGRVHDGAAGQCERGGEPGLFDLGDWAGCSQDEGPVCEAPSRRVVTAMTELPDGTVETHYACVRR